MEKTVMIRVVKEVLNATFGDNDFIECLREMVFEKLQDDAAFDTEAIDILFDECYKELVEKIRTCLK